MHKSKRTFLVACAVPFFAAALCFGPQVISNIRRGQRVQRIAQQVNPDSAAMAVRHRIEEMRKLTGKWPIRSEDLARGQKPITYGRYESNRSAELKPGIDFSIALVEAPKDIKKAEYSIVVEVDGQHHYRCEIDLHPLWLAKHPNDPANKAHRANGHPTLGPR